MRSPVKRRVLVIAAHSKDDDEIAQMAVTIAEKKARHSNVELVTCTTGKLDEMDIPAGHFDEVVLCAHGRYYQKEDVRAPGAALLDLDKSYDSSTGKERHIAEQSFLRVANFLGDLIAKNAKLSDIRLVVCESALSDETKKIPKKMRKVSSKKGDVKKNTVVTLSRNAEKLEKLVCHTPENWHKGGRVEKLTNLELLIGMISERLGNKKYREFSKEHEITFQGINGVGFIKQGEGKVRAFDQKDLEMLQKKPDTFEEDYVEGYKFVPKIRIRTTFQPRNHSPGIKPQKTK